MRTSRMLATSAVALALMTGAASAVGLGGLTNGTPDAQNGAQGRNNPTSYYGHLNGYSGRSVGYGNGYGPGYGYGPSYVRPYPHRRYPAW